MNKIPGLNDLPSVKRSGWPWTEGSSQIVGALPDGAGWPKISIVTPSYNQAQFLEETIRSVLLQGYPNLEYIIIDGGSTDGSVEIIKKYAPWLAYWESEKDAGQCQAFNKGFAQSTGKIMAWINSDDTYAPGALRWVAEAFHTQDTLWVAGITHKTNAEGEITQAGRKRTQRFETWYIGGLYQQQGIFWHRLLWERAGHLAQTLQYSFDYDLWMRFIQVQPFATRIDHHLANFRIHHESKTTADQLKFMKERQKIYRHYPVRVDSLSQRYTIWKGRRERKTRIIRGLDEKDFPFTKKLFLILLFTPWHIFRISFWYRIKKKLQG